MFSTEIRDGVELLTCRALNEHAVPHGFTSRRNGFGVKSRAAADHAALARALELDVHASMQQVHGRRVETLEAPGPAGECDGVVTDRRGLGLIVHTADCVPLLMWASDVNAVSAVHAGWRGTLANVAAAATEVLVRDKLARPEAVHVAVGPSIRVCCFEVGDEVVDAFVRSARTLDAVSRPGLRGRRHLDLVADNVRQLTELGVPESQIHDSGLCTACELDRFYSFRREGPATGRLMGVIAAP